MPEAHHKRVFFALWPNESIRDSISSIYKKSIYKDSLGQAHGTENLHLTLHFLGGLSPSQVDCALQQAEQVNAQKFELTLDSFACFKKAKILYMSPSEASLQLTELHQLLAESLAVCHLRLETRRYQPHVTLMRKFKDFKASEISQKVLWKVEQFALLESVSTPNGVEYRPLQLFTLGGRG